MFDFIKANIWRIPMPIQQIMFYPLWKNNQLKEKVQIKEDIKKFEIEHNMSRGELEEAQLIKLKRLLRYANEHVEYYKTTWREEKVNIDKINSFEDLVKIPTIDKKIINECPDRFISDEYKKSMLIRKATGGSTGVPLYFYFDDKAERSRANVISHWRYLAGVYNYNNKSVWIGSSSLDLINNQKRWGEKGEKFHGSYNFHHNRIAFSSFNLVAEVMDKYIACLKWYKPDYIQGYSSAIATLALYMNTVGESIKLKAVLSGSDELTEKGRKACERAFQCQVYNEYGMNEETVAAVECGDGKFMRCLMQNSLMETVNTKGEQIFDVIGEFVGTNLNNYAMPFIRYKTGDLGILSKDNRPYKGGWDPWIIKELHGRSKDTILLHNGKVVDHPTFSVLVHHISKDLEEFLVSLKEYQLHQMTKDEIIVNVVTKTGEELTGKEEEKFLEILNIIFKDLEMKYLFRYYSDSIPRGKNGKFRCFISEIF